MINMMSKNNVSKKLQDWPPMQSIIGSRVFIQSKVQQLCFSRFCVFFPLFLLCFIPFLYMNCYFRTFCINCEYRTAYIYIFPVYIYLVFPDRKTFHLYIINCFCFLKLYYKVKNYYPRTLTTFTNYIQALITI